MSSAFLIAGAGFSGAVLAHRLSELLPGCTIDIWEEKSHIAGNSYTQRDSETGIMVHRYTNMFYHNQEFRLCGNIQQLVLRLLRQKLE